LLLFFFLNKSSTTHVREVAKWQHLKILLLLTSSEVFTGGAQNGNITGKYCEHSQQRSHSCCPSIRLNPFS